MDSGIWVELPLFGQNRKAGILRGDNELPGVQGRQLSDFCAKVLMQFRILFRGFLSALFFP